MKSIFRSKPLVLAHCQKRPFNLLAAMILAFACLAPKAFAANGTAQYIDVNGTSGGFGTPSGAYDQNANTVWTTDATGVAAPTVFTSGDAMTFGAVATDLTNATFSVN